MPSLTSWTRLSAIAYLAALSTACAKTEDAAAAIDAPAVMQTQAAPGEIEASLLATVFQASDAQLMTIAGLRRDLLIALSKSDSRSCANEFYGDFQTRDAGSLPQAAQDISRRHRQAMLEAAAVGKASPLQHLPFKGAVETAASAAIDGQGLTARELELVDGAPPTGAAEACRTGILIYSGVMRLPTAQGGAWMSQVVGRAARLRAHAETYLAEHEEPLSVELLRELKVAKPSAYEDIIDRAILAGNGASF